MMPKVMNIPQNGKKSEDPYLYSLPQVSFHVLPIHRNYLVKGYFFSVCLELKLSLKCSFVLAFGQKGISHTRNWAITKSLDS